MINKERMLNRIIRLSAYLLLIAAALLLVWSVVMRLDFIEELPWYKNYQFFLHELKYKVETLENKFLIFILIELFFILKSIIALVPISLICLISAAVFPLHIALPINILGICLMFSLRYLSGYLLGRDSLVKLLEKYETTKKILSHNGSNNPLLLFVFRFVPVFPANRISGFYGSKKYDYKKFLLFSLLGYTPRLVSYSIAGRNVFKTFSLSFLSPLIVIFTISGISMLTINGILESVLKKSEAKKNGNSNIHGNSIIKD